MSEKAKEHDAKQPDLTALLSLTAQQEKTISKLYGVEKVFRGRGLDAESVLVYVICGQGIAALSDNGQIIWQR